LSLKKHLFNKGAFFMMIRAGMKRSTNKYCFLQVSFLIQLDLKSLDPVRPSKVVKDTKLMYLGKA
jgi:hypothetical protein